MRQLFTILLATLVVAGWAQKKPKINQAKSALEKGEYAEAKSIVDAAIEHEKTKDDPVTWFIRGQVYAALDTANNEPGAMDESLAAFEKTLELDPDQKKVSSFDLTTQKETSVDTKMQGYYAHYFNSAIENYQAEEFQSAANNFEKAFYIMPSDTNSAVNAGYAANAAENFEQAEKNFKKAIEAGSIEKNIFLQLYNFAVKDSSYTEALEIVQKGRKALPEDVDLMKYEVNLYMLTDKMDEAKKGLEEAIEADPDNADLIFNYASLKEQSGDIDGATEAYNKALTVDPNHFNSSYNLGVIAYNKVGSLIKEQGTLNYYPGQSRPNAQEKKKYDELQSQIGVELKNALPIWERLSNHPDADDNVKNILEDIQSRLKKF